MSPDVQVGDSVVMKDRHPGGKFCTPYEREVWDVVNIQGTMVTVQRGQSTVSRNILWFKRVPPKLHAPVCDNQSKEDTSAPSAKLFNPNRASLPSSPEPPSTRSSPLPPTIQEIPNSQSTAAGTCQDTVGHSQRYGLRPNFVPRKRLKDYVCYH